MNYPITISESAINKIKEIQAEDEDTKDAFLRVFVSGGGCSGFQYGFNLEVDSTQEDFIIEKGGIKILVDSMSMQYLNDAEIDYVDDLSGAQFTIKNPNAVTTCGCGSSFSI